MLLHSPIPNAPKDDGDTSFPRYPTLRPISEIMCDPRNGGAGFKPTVVGVGEPETGTEGEETVDFIDALGVTGSSSSSGGGRRDEQYPVYDWGALDDEVIGEEEEETGNVEEEPTGLRPLRTAAVHVVTLCTE